MKKRTMRLGCILLSTVLLGTAALTGCGQAKRNTTDTKKTESSSTKGSAKKKKDRILSYMLTFSGRLNFLSFF